jgi:shikimate kinase
MIRYDMRRTRRHAAGDVVALKAALGRRTLVFVGIMGCGKSSVGRRLAAALDLKFVDADEEIELAAGQTIPEIFESHGEDYFRAGERRVIARLLQSGPQVLATGGGAYMNEQTRANIKTNGIAIWLKADLPLLMKRVMRRDNRPLLKTSDPQARMQELMAIRYPIYGQADLTVESRDAPHDEIVANVIAGLLKGPLAPAQPSQTAPESNSSEAAGE